VRTEGAHPRSVPTPESDAHHSLNLREPNRDVLRLMAELAAD
jgi:hypothetical protein